MWQDFKRSLGDSGKPAGWQDYLKVLADRRQLIFDYRESHPHATLQVIGEEFGISRERVRQILKKAGKATKADRIYKTHPCSDCGEPVRASLKPRCPDCSNAWRKNRITTLACSYCGKLTQKETWRVQESPTGKFFCSIKCSNHRSTTPRSKKALPGDRIYLKTGTHKGHDATVISLRTNTSYYRASCDCGTTMTYRSPEFIVVPRFLE